MVDKVRQGYQISAFNYMCIWLGDIMQCIQVNDNYFEHLQSHQVGEFPLQSKTFILLHIIATREYFKSSEKASGDRLLTHQ